MTTAPITTASLIGSKIDVPSIVSKLMEIERRPLDKVQSKIDASQVKISALGQFNNKLDALKVALDALQAKTNFTGVAPEFSRTGVLTAAASDTAGAGVHTIEIARLAQPEVWRVGGFVDAKAAQDWYDGTDQSLLRNQANAAIIKQPDNKYALLLTAKSDNFEPSIPNTLTKDRVMTGQSAMLKVDGMSYERPTNIVSDVIVGLTLTLNSTTTIGDPVTMTLTPSSDSIKTKIDNLVSAFNQLRDFYNAQTQSSIDASNRGIFNSDSFINGIMRQIMDALSRPLSDSSGSVLSGHNDLSLLGLKMSDQGLLQLDEAKFAQATNLQSILASGLRVGFDSSSNMDLSQKIYEITKGAGLMDQRLQGEAVAQQNLSKRKVDLELKLQNVQAHLTAQYAALDALLFKLSGTSESLKSSLDALVNSQNKS